ncbi:unnamed protein product [Rotaria socialis]|uniref:Uncharacterized protein n=1 Tax=Rotaria socialis TaxID=392032 RepID=A0A818BBW0_9BILA|nr:unnamed protein product [Rotaria socialis]CAF3320844.1 unnamed protein product [Rotaria socialis]CAF3413469.1 unnamed protein product [Rotaria socialis]CAF3782585.1 unnamed protein product [Rotaria socialis]
MLLKQPYVIYAILNGSRFRLQCDMIKMALIDLIELVDIDYGRNGKFEFNNNNKHIYSLIVLVLDSYRYDPNDTLWDIYI